ncbi:MAG: IS110 family transposase [Candidatus Rokubacteria bacterium]|nr:IS110 family transposase [Candidatus Rokubacteria bacterium]
MDVIHPKCAGLDVHKDSVVACARLVTGQKATHEVKTFGTTTRDLLALADWLTARGCTHVAMEATGVYWKPVWHVLEGSFELVLANAMHIRNIPGRKTDVNDATWIADLLAHGLIRGSFVPAPPLQDLRDLTRTRTQLVRERARHILRIQKTLENANLKLASVLTDVLGVTGRNLLEALIAGEASPERLADLAHDPRLKASRAEFVEALHGRITPHHRFILALHLRQIDALDTAVREIEARLEDALAPFRAAVARLTTIRGIAETAAHVLIAEIGVDMSHFPSAGHLISWAGLCPRLHESAGKRRSTRTRHGNRWLKTMLVQAAWGAVRHHHGGYLRAQFVRLRSRRGPKKAILAVAASMLTAAYYMLRDGTDYRDLGADHFDRREKAKLARRLITRLHDLGFTVEVRAA